MSTTDSSTNQAPQGTLRELTPAELRLVVGGQEMDHGARIRR